MSRRANQHRDWRATVSVILIGIGSCKDPSAAVQQLAAQLQILTAESVMQIGVPLSLEAVVLDTKGGAIDGADIDWLSLTPAIASVTASGVVHGVAPGEATISATSGSVQATKNIMVEAATIPVASVSISPAQDTVMVGNTVMFTATPRDADGDPLVGRIVSWSTGNPTVASVNGSGTVAGVAAGATVISGNSEGVPGNANIVVIADTNPPSAAYPNRPSGMTTIMSFNGTVEASGGHAFGNPMFGAWFVDPAAPASHIEVVPDATNPTGSGSSLRFRWEQAFNPRSGIATANTFAGQVYNELYVMVRLFLEPGAGWEGGFGNKYFFVGSDAGARNNTQSSPTQYYSTRESNGRARFVTQNLTGQTQVVNSSESPPTGNSSAPLVTGQWLNIEYRMVAQSSTSAADGAIYVWVNGTLVGSNTGVRWVNADDSMVGFTGFQWYADANTVATVSYYRMGELLLAVK